jgi:MFS family permease
VEEITNKKPIEQQRSSVRPWSSFLLRDFRLIWLAVLCASTSIHMRSVTNLYQVYEVSGSSLQLGLTGLFQALPFICFALFSGVLADIFNRKKLIISTQLLNIIPALILGVLTATRATRVWHIYLLSLMTSSLQVLGGPARMALIPTLVPPSHLMNAVTLNTITHRASLLLGPVLAGFLIDLVGLDFTYFVDGALMLPAIVAVLSIKSPGKPAGERQKIDFRNVLKGFRFVLDHRIILSLLLLDFGATLVGYYRPILPVFASDVFKVGASGLGALYSAPAVGALFGTGLLLAAGDFRRKGAVAVLGTFLFGGSLALLGLAKWFWMGLLAVGAAGFADAISVIIRQTTVQYLAPDDMRGRAASLVTVFANSTNALGAVLAGAAAALVGAPNALLLGGVLCTMIILGICWAIPQLWSYRSE